MRLYSVKFGPTVFYAHARTTTEARLKMTSDIIALLCQTTETKWPGMAATYQQQVAEMFNDARLSLEWIEDD